jgi:UDP-N-acetylglucosamine 4-epimerase
MKTILVTGGAGFIGSNIVEYLLLNTNYNVKVIDNLITGKIKNLEPFINDKWKDRFEFVYGDICNLEKVRRVMKGVNMITHQAALGSVPRSINDPLSSHKSNVNGFLNVLIAANEEGIKKIVYASSSSVYGDNNTLPKIENNIGQVLSPYAATKKIDEIYANVFTKCYGMQCIGLRYFNVFGPRQDPNGAYAAVIPKFINLMKNNKPPTINGDGKFSRDFTYVENVVQANLKALETKDDNCFGQVFNIGAGGRVSLNQLVDILKKELKYKGEIIYGENRAGDIPHSNADITKAETYLSYEPKINFEKGIIKLLNYPTL